MISTKTVLCGSAALLSGGMGYASQTSRPNIIIIMTDQLRADLMGREGYPLETMPFTDGLAKRGTWFNRAYTSAPASAPARVSMLTGRFPSATHVKSNHNIPDVFYKKDMFDVARESGYRTALVGKNHSYLTPDKADYWSIYDHDGQRPASTGYPVNAEYDRYLKSLGMYTNLEPTPFGVETQSPYRMVDDALEWIGTLDGNPFLMWFSIPEPHNPYQVCEPYYSMFPPESLPRLKTGAVDMKTKGSEYELLAEMMAMGHTGYPENLDRLRSIYHGMIRMIDDQIRRFMNRLSDIGISDNTIVVFVADHGDFAGEYGLMKKGVGLDEVLVRIPMQWTGTGITASTKPHTAHVSIVDIFPTVCEIMGVGIPDGVQGRSLWPLLTGQPYPREEFSAVMAQDGYGGMYYTKSDSEDYKGEGAVRSGGFFDELNSWTQSGTIRMLRSGDWKLVYDMDGNGYLYDLSKDPLELDNLFGHRKHAGIRNEMIEKLLRWDVSTVDPLPLPRARYRFKSNPHNYLFSQ